MVYDLVIIGGGPAGTAGAVYAGRKQLKTVLVTESFGGQSVVSDDIQNWIGEPHISGVELAKKFEQHVKECGNVEIIKGELVVKLEKGEKGFVVVTNKERKLETKTVLLASGARRRRLGVPGEDRLERKGVAYCSTCDAPLFQGLEVAVVGGGNAGLEAVLDLAPYATKIYLLEQAEELKGDKMVGEEIEKIGRVEIVLGVKVTEILGEKMVEGIKYQDLRNGEEKELKVEGVFVEIGSVPNSEIAKGLVERNKQGEVLVDHKTQRTSLVGVWAAGDVTDVLYKQNNISAGDAIKAVMNIQEYLWTGEENGKDGVSGFPPSRE